MKQIATVLLILISLTSYSQGKYPITVSGSGGGGGTTGGRYTTNNYGTLVDSATTNLYKIIVDTTVIASQARLSTMLALKLNISDTAGMLSGYQTAINNRVKYTDTSSMLSAYQTAINARVKYTDTSSMLSGYQTAINKNTDSITAHNTRIGKNTDSLISHNTRIGAVTVSNALKFSTVGNSSLSRSSNFFGTTDNTPVPIRINNTVRGYWDTATYDGSILTGLLSLGNYLTIPTTSKNVLFISDSNVVTTDVFRIGITSVPLVVKTGGTSAAFGQVFGANFEPRIGASNTVNWTSTQGMVGVRGTSNVQSGATGTLTNARAVVGASDFGAMTITNASRIYAETPFIHGGTVTNNYGVYVEPQTGGTNNYQLYLGNSGAGAANYGIYNISQNNQFVSATQLADGVPLINMTATLSNGATNTQQALPMTFTTAGSAAQPQFGINLQMAAGYTGSSVTGAGIFNNSVAGTGSTYGATSGNTSYRISTGNLGVGVNVAGTTTGINVGARLLSGGGNTNYGVWASTTVSKASSTNIAVAGFSVNSAGTAAVAGLFSLADYSTSAPTVSSTALLVDNGATTSPIALFRDNGTVIATMADGGAVRIGDATSPTDKLEVTGNIALTTAGNKLKIATGSNASMGVSSALSSGTITISTTAVTSSSKIFLTHATVAGTQGILSVGTIVNGASFVINSSNAADTGTVNWWIVN